LRLITRFDPWRSSLCTCPPKLTLNPYTGCDYNCVYCYASSYVPRFSQCRPKKDLLKRLANETRKLRGETVSMSNSSDPYPNMEAELELTRGCLKTLSKSHCRIQIITKSPLVQRDSDLLKNTVSMVAMTITTLSEDTAKLLEPNAPSPKARLKTIETLSNHDIPVAARIDPIIPGINDDTKKLIETLASIGVKHITCSTYKAKTDNWERFAKAMPDAAVKLEPFYFENGERLDRSAALPKHLRLSILSCARSEAEKHNVRFGVCREGLGQLNTASCDGSWLLKR
jgi:DNA repair photolyase